MRTIIFACEKHINEVNKYKLYLEPFLKNKDIKICNWNYDGKTLEECVPDIYKCIGSSKKWRAVLLCDFAENSRQNPFDEIQFDDFKKLQESLQKKKSEFETEIANRTNIKDGSVSDSEWEILYDEYKNRIEEINDAQEKLNGEIEHHKIEQYEKASKQPLTILSTYLCALPLDSKTDSSFDDADDNPGDEYSSFSYVVKQKEQKQFKTYKTIAKSKQEIREKIINGYVLKANQPQDVLCISTRTITRTDLRDKEAIDLAWRTNTKVIYSRFCDSNMYYDRMRFFVYDILPEAHCNYKFEYLKFLYTLLIFASNDMPSDAVQANRLYCLESKCDEDRLDNIINTYNDKLKKTVDTINNRVKEIEADVPSPLTDAMAENIFQSHDVVPVKIEKDFNTEGLYPTSEGIGLSNLCPDNESSVWAKKQAKSVEVLHGYLKQPKRSLEKAINEFRYRNSIKDIRAISLNHFQVEDIQEYVDKEEEKMVGIKTNDFYDVKRYDERVKKGDASVRNILGTRMNKKTTALIGVISLFAYLIGYISLIIYNENITTVPISLLILIFAVGLLAIVGFITLFVLRKEVTDEIDNYNDVIKSIDDDVLQSMQQFSDYLSCASHIMRGNYAVSASKAQDTAYKQKIRVLRGHIEKIKEKQQADIYDLFGEYCLETDKNNQAEPYRYNFEMVADYPYPIPFDSSGEHKIPFIQETNRVSVPLDLIDEVSIRMEELYE